MENVRFLRFDFDVFVDGNPVYTARHLWDRWTGRYREEGQAYRDGELLEGEDKAEALDQARYNYLNDTYWLLMPWKLHDPGVNLSAFSQETEDGHSYDVLHLTFGAAVGDTPGDQHWIFVNPETGALERTGYFLERFEKNPPVLGEATLWNWSNWTELNGLLFARTREVVRTTHDPFETARSEFSLIAILPDVDDAVFTSFDVPMPNK